jgi:hypothetical protein
MTRLQCAYPCREPDTLCGVCYFRAKGIPLPGDRKGKEKPKAPMKAKGKRDYSALVAFVALAEESVAEMAQDAK